MLWGGGKPSIAPDYMADADRVVVDGEGEMVGREAVRLQEHVVVEGVVAKGERPQDQVMKSRAAVERYRLADDEALTCRRAPLGLLSRDRSAATVIALRLMAGSLLGTHLLQPLGRAKAAIRGARGEKSICRFLIDGLPL